MYQLLSRLLCYISDSSTEIDTLIMKRRQDLKASTLNVLESFI